MGSVLQPPVLVLPNSGTTLKSLGVTHKLTSAQTGGAFYLCEAEFSPERGSPLHIHHYEDEVITVLAGALDVRLAHEKLQVPVGGTIHLPKHVPHALQNPLNLPLKIMVYTIQVGWKNILMRLRLPYKMGLSMQKFIQKYPQNMGWNGWNEFSLFISNL